jgi:cobalt-precorrin-7 (C5)-methyltransferase
MKIIGVGCGPGLLTEQAIREISRATVIFGSDRAIALAKSHIPFDCTVKTIDDFKNLDKLAKDAIILSTGDPMLAGLGYLQGEVIPGISSLQVATARLHIPVSRVSVVVAHGKGHEKGMQDTIEEVQRGKIVFLLADPTKTQVSLVLLIIGLIMLFIPYLKYFDSIVPGISQSFNLMFYLGLVLIVIGYYLK